MSLRTRSIAVCAVCADFFSQIDCQITRFMSCEITINRGSRPWGWLKKSAQTAQTAKFARQAPERADAPSAIYGEETAGIRQFSAARPIPTPNSTHNKEETVTARMSEDDFRSAMREVEIMTNRLEDVPNILGPTYGAARCDQALKVLRDLHTLSIGISDRAYDCGWDVPICQRQTPVRHAGAARHELAGTFDPTTLVTRRNWPPLTAREHHALGLRIREVRSRITTLFCKLANARPNWDLPQRVKKTEHALHRLSDVMDGYAHRELAERREPW